MDPFSPGCLESVTPNHWLSLSSKQVFPQGSPWGLPTTFENNVIISYLENYVILGEQMNTSCLSPMFFSLQPRVKCPNPCLYVILYSVHNEGRITASYVTVSYLVQMCFLERWFLFVEMTGRGDDQFTPTEAVQNPWQCRMLGEEFPPLLGPFI